LGDDALAPQNGGGHAETFAAPAEYRLQDGINIGRRTVLRLPVRQTRWFQCTGFWRFAHFISRSADGLETWDYINRLASRRRIGSDDQFDHVSACPNGRFHFAG
jgi:hypothetical protein